MRIEHIAIWTYNLERLKTFYEKFFGATAGLKYVNPIKKYSSYFLSFSDGCRLEIMEMPGIKSTPNTQEHQHTGLIHFAVSVGDKSSVDKLTEILRAENCIVAGEPRTTGDGYYESVVLDPDGNRIEITI